ncbi:hypothetical protein MMC26_006372 [Xylographa opegraphella]|nr:hypothetical protein [Xylographa opegraphella]
MISTRAQDHGSGEAVVKEEMDELKNGKRKSCHNEEWAEEEATKRQRLSQDREVENRIDVPSPPQNMGDDFGSQSSEGLLQLSEQSTVTSQSTLIDTTVPLSDHISKTQPLSLLNSDELSVTNKPLDNCVDDTRTAAPSQNEDSKTTDRSNQGKRRRKSSEVAHTLSNGHSMTEAPAIRIDAHGKGNKPELKRATHKRFGSEEALVPPNLSSNKPIQDQNMNAIGTHKVQLDSEDESEDDSPEVVTVSAGLTQARTAAAEAARAAETQSLALKEKRRARDVHLKEQAATSKRERRSHGKYPSKLDDATSTVHDSNAAKPNSATARSRNPFKRTEPLPDLLPAEILAAEPVVRPPTPPRTVTIADPRKRRFLDADPKPLKDWRRGSVTVRILEESNSALPPRSSELSKGIKERWLAGHRGRNDMASRRLKMGGGFVRK